MLIRRLYMALKRIRRQKNELRDALLLSAGLAVVLLCLATFVSARL
jgi:hypothetical protein